jgi:two-component system cell cycle response regulator
MHELDDTAHWDPKKTEAQGHGRRAWLTVITGSETGRVYPLSAGTFGIGRGTEADIQIADLEISRMHTELIVMPDGTATARDCGSKNGTMLGSRPLGVTPRPLRDGAKLQVGGAVVMRFSFRDQLEERFERKLYESASRDELTGVYNKHHLMARLEREFAYSRRDGRPMALVLLDLDDFKAVNDSFGHAAGDHALFEVASTLAQTLRGDSLVARFGGEEFVVLVPRSDQGEGLLVAERLRRALEGIVISWEGSRIPVSASFGVASTSQVRAHGPTDLIRLADDCLYRAKRHGKNRVCGLAARSA